MGSIYPVDMRSLFELKTNFVTSRHFIGFESVITLNGIRTPPSRLPNIPFILQKDKLDRTCDVDTKHEFCKVAHLKIFHLSNIFLLIWQDKDLRNNTCYCPHVLELPFDGQFAEGDICTERTELDTAASLVLALSVRHI